ncbi:MAG TPA: metalloprotease, partial [Candidatus Nanoarchaeia archaeon]|nr:metalloprotease [Candidatus Nanoarchaeia archaeon]
MHFSSFELKEIAKALLAVSLMFAIATVGISARLLVVFPIVLLTAGLGFVLHELAHKFLAQKYGAWAEFRSNNQMLLVGVLLSFTGFVLAAPGGVYIQGATKDQHGKIAL